APAPGCTWRARAPPGPRRQVRSPRYGCGSRVGRQGPSVSLGLVSLWFRRVTSGAMATTPEHRTIAPIVGPDDPRRFTDSGIEIERLYTEEDLPSDLPERLGEPGEYPFTRGAHKEMYR